MSPFARYSLFRLLLFFAVTLVLYLLGARGLLLLVLAAVTSAAASYLLMRGLRDDVANRLVQRREGSAPRGRFQASVDDANAAEDADADQMHKD